ncbi:RagB/SusD family nutrient uptake outer membrane protein [Arenibacter certesii]|uniref:Membrane protein n=1 Tax=Arenibacter certesii TaxID=228955 RepID=A0A918MPW6_9FLAO|nr:RagB/SusD family nutrient uptake outer membrane protein [Arenibacter certesii]GGW48297.1 membrane protein [Arenibacter certesii]
MKKISKISIVFVLTLFVFSCEDLLDKTQLDLIGEDKVWNDESLIDAYMADIYSSAEFHMGTQQGNTSRRRHVVLDAGGEARARDGVGAGLINGSMSESGADGDIDYWDWENVRRINVAIQELSNTESTLETSYRETSLGEAYFIRAWVYFSMVKRYGGLPIIKEPQNLTLSLEELKVARSTEEETYDFIGEDCDKAEVLLEGKVQPWGKATNWAALALKSRAMLYAGSIGEFGKVKLNGLVGVSNADKYWDLSLAASQKIIQNGPFQLFDNAVGGTHADKIESYTTMTLTDNPITNTELIFSERFNGAGGKGSSYDLYYHPNVDGNTGWGAVSQVYLETAEMFEYADGSAGTLDRNTLVPGQRHNVSDLFGNKDPRFYASIAIQGTDFGGAPVYFHEGTYVGGVLTLGGTNNGLPASGDSRNSVNSALLNIKGIVREEAPDYNQGTNDWTVFRLGEIYLNYAEAKLALGDDGDGLTKLNAIRTRAGLPLVATLDWPTLKQERTVELIFENHRYWDLRRWRDAEEQLTDVANGGAATFTGLKWLYDADVDKYEITVTNGNNRPERTPNERRFDEKHYYFPIGSGRIADNSVLIENPDY